MRNAMGKETKRRDCPPRAAKDERRDAIVAIAHEAFLANGYAGTSMSAIAARLGGSKGTLYNYFASKEELFAAVIERKSEQVLSFLYDAEIEGGDLGSALTQFCRRFLELALAEDTIATFRLVTAECARFPEIGHTLYKTGPLRGREHMRRFLARAKDAGQLTGDADIELAAEQIFALCLFAIQQRRLWLVTPMPSSEEIRRQAEGAVATFLRAFGA
jgi:AcrR family transcriptional regulator